MNNKKPRYNEVVFTSEEEEKIVNMYTVDKCSTVKIGKAFNVSHKKIARVLDKYGIERIGNGRRKYNLNENYFDSIDTPNKAYILGFLYADGCNCSTKQTISMSLQEDDKEILEKIRLEIGNEHPLEFIDYSNKNDFGYTYKNQYRLLMFSSHMCTRLSEIGMVPSKSLVLNFPDIPSHLYSHFIRGYFDGDGSISFNKTNAIFSLTSTESFCIHVKNFLENMLSIHMYITDASNKNGTTKVLSTSGNIQVKKLMDYLYRDADLYMERKYLKYRNKYYLTDDKEAVA